MNDRLMERLAKANEKIEDLTSTSESAVHPIIMDSPHGTYMVLQRMIQTGSIFGTDKREWFNRL